MNKNITIIAAVSIMMATACKEKKQPVREDIITTRQEVPAPKAPITMQEYKDIKDVEWQGKKYRVEIARTPADSLPMVKDELGQKYVDNRITLIVSRQDSTVFYKRSFTKNAFASYLDDDYRSKGILEAMIFEKVADGALEFAVSIAHPQSEDEFIPLTMKLDRDGGLNIKRDTEIDTNGYDEDTPAQQN